MFHWFWHLFIQGLGCYIHEGLMNNAWWPEKLQAGKLKMSMKNPACWGWIQLWPQQAILLHMILLVGFHVPLPGRRVLPSRDSVAFKTYPSNVPFPLQLLRKLKLSLKTHFMQYRKWWMSPPPSKLHICDFSRSPGLAKVSAGATAGKEEELLIFKTYLQEMRSLEPQQDGDTGQTWSSSGSPCCHCQGQEPLLSGFSYPFHRWENWGPERQSNFPWISQQIVNRASTPLEPKLLLASPDLSPLL